MSRGDVPSSQRARGSQVMNMSTALGLSTTFRGGDAEGAPFSVEVRGKDRHDRGHVPHLLSPC